VARGEDVGKWDNVLQRVRGGKADQNIRFHDLRGMLARLGYAEHITGDHHIFRYAGRPEIIAIQPQRDGKAKAYQVRQIRAVLFAYGITKIP
jgi:hypothetical protein